MEDDDAGGDDSLLRMEVREVRGFRWARLLALDVFCDILLLCT